MRERRRWRATPAARRSAPSDSPARARAACRGSWCLRDVPQAGPLSCPSVDVHQGTAHGERRACLDFERAGRFDRDGGRPDIERAVRLQRDGAALVLDLELVALLVLENDLVVGEADDAAVLVRELHHTLRTVVEQQVVVLARLDDAFVVLAIVVGERGLVAAVPQ